jgi:hypothetical protein
MGHQHHFLSRLDRVSIPHVELALSLYRDHELVHYLLQSVRLPEGAERVAISLQHPERGPFLVVTRDGRFVTCLGEGMEPTGLPVITRGQLDGIAAKAEDIRARLVECQKLIGERGGMGKLLKRLYDAGNELSREEFVAISALQPLYALEFLQSMYAVSRDLHDAREILLRNLRNTDKLKPRFRESLRTYWNSVWAVGHFAVLSALDGKNLLTHLPEGPREIFLAGPFAWPALREGIPALAFRGLWATARIGKPFLPACKEFFAKMASHMSALNGTMSLAALGLRHARLRAEVEKTLQAPRSYEFPLIRSICEPILDTVNRVLKMDAEDPEGCAAIQRSIGAQIAMAATRHLPEGSPLRFAREEDVPFELGLCMAINVGTPFLDDFRVTPSLMMLLLWVARAEAESLYLPREVLRVLHKPWEPEMTMDYLLAYRDHYHRRWRPKHVKPKGPARQGPCPCGSGKKYKRCCEVREES